MQSMRKRGVKYSVLLIVVLATMTAGPNCRVEAQQASVPPEVLHYADIVLYNGKVATVDENFTIVDAVAMRDGKFLAVGTTDRVLPLAGPQTRRIDLKGKMALPGFVDTHQHPFGAGLGEYVQSKSKLRPERGKHLTDYFPDVRRIVQAAQPGELVLVYAGAMGFCGSAMLDQLDAVSPNNPVVVMGPVNNWPEAVNSKAAALVDRFVDGPTFRKPGSACLSIEAREAVSGYVISRIPFEELLKIGRLATRMASSNGITTAKEHAALPMMGVVTELWKRKELTVRMRMPYPFYPLTGNQSVVPPKLAEKLFMYSGNLSGIGDDMFRLTNIRPSAVGGNLMLGSAWTLEAKQQELPGMTERPYGLASGTWDPEVGSYLEGEGESFAGREALVQAIRYGWDVATDHTVGDQAVEEVLKAMEEGLKTRVVHRPGQILAMGHTPMSTPAQIRKMKELGVRPGIGPWHVFKEGAIEGGFIAYGTERLNQMEPFRTFLDTGVRASLEGDTFGDPTFWKLQAAITRKDEKYGRVWNAQQRITREEALRMSTNNGAYQFGEEDKLGSIEAGKLADLIVIDNDYLTIPEEEIATIKVLLTIVGGRVVYEVEGGLQ